MPKPRRGSAASAGGGSGRRGGGASSSKKSAAARPAARKPSDKPRPADPAQQSQRQQQQHPLSFALQQRLLDVFARTLGATLASPRLQEALQAVKRALFERDFASAFGGDSQDTAADDLPPLLDAYAARWSPTRALCYAAILSSPLVQEHWRGLQQQQQQQQEGPSAEPQAPRPPFRMVALGGAAAEIVAFGAVLAMDADTHTAAGADENALATVGHVVLVDSGPWANVVHRLHAGLVPGKAAEDADAEAAATDADEALVHPADRLSVDVRQLDVLAMDDHAMTALFPTAAATPTLVTLFFTLNELFTAGGLGAAATFLMRLTAASPPATVLLVVDSPGSYAETAVGVAKMRRYPMQWLLDKILLQESNGSGDGDDAADGIADAASSAPWTKVHQDEAVWFRLPPSLRYPIRLEDMRYQVHLYVRR